MTTTNKMRSTDTAWYLLLGEMQRFDIHVTRDWFKTLIKKICDAAGIKRADYGLITGARADFYFDSGWASVSFDAINELDNGHKYYYYISCISNNCRITLIIMK